MSYSRVKNEVLRLAQDDRCLDVILNEVKDLAPKAVQIQSRDPSGEKHAVRMTNKDNPARSGRQRIVILRPGVWPKDLALELFHRFRC